MLCVYPWRSLRLRVHPRCTLRLRVHPRLSAMHDGSNKSRPRDATPRRNQRENRSPTTETPVVRRCASLRRADYSRKDDTWGSIDVNLIPGKSVQTHHHGRGRSAPRHAREAARDACSAVPPNAVAFSPACALFSRVREPIPASHISVASCFRVGSSPGPPARARAALTALGATRYAPWLHAIPPLHALVHGLPRPAPQSSSIASRAAFAAAVASASIAAGTS